LQRGKTWKKVSRGVLLRILSDTSDFGQGWRVGLGGAPMIASADSILEITDEATCKKAAAIVWRDVLGVSDAGPPVVIFGVRDYLIVYPADLHLGEWGLAVGMDRALAIHGDARW
jgi:hypothetical protein